MRVEFVRFWTVDLRGRRKVSTYRMRLSEFEPNGLEVVPHSSEWREIPERLNLAQSTP